MRVFIVNKGCFHEKKKSCPWLLIDRVKWLCACVMCWPHWVGVSVCHLAFIVVFNYVTHRSLNVIHLPTRLPWENSFAVPNPALQHVWHVKLPVKGVLNTPACYVSYAMLMRPKRPKELSMAAN